MFQLGDFTTTDTIYVPFSTYDSNGASVTLSGFAVTDIEIYKDGSTTQRTSDNGITLLDTDGTDFDSQTGIHGFSVDLSDDSDSGFYANGSQYWIVVSSVTVDSQTVRVLFTFSIGMMATRAALATVDTVVDAIKAVTDLLPDSGALSSLATAASISALNDLSAAQVNAQVVDVLRTDTSNLDTVVAQGAPTNTPTFEEAVMYLYKRFRNKKEQTATEWRLYDNAGTTVDHKSTVSDDGTTFTKGEVGTGP